ncbi:MAG TPA: class I SAM-dependent methyltransferase [Acetobacteraceae bacterium]|nr:class I SAM-dependent methyltransferase [Acetobacteraceae bacterium]
MSGWGSGYVTDVTYTPGYYRYQSPQLMALACQLSGVMSPMPGADDPVSYLELGCGHGLGALILAASNPHWTVTAVDFHPAHIAVARDWAAAAGIGNVTFIEGDLATLAEDAAGANISDADFVSMHGVWSWVPKAVQAGIVRLLRAKVKPGGAVHVSYNSLPAWGSVLGMQRLVHDCGQRLAMRSDRQAEEGLKLARELLAADALHFQRSPLASSLIERAAAQPSSYLAHEYMNASFAPCFHADVAGALADAKLEWVGAVNLIENFPELTLTPEQRAVMQRLDDPLLRELVKDTCLERALRHDVYVRGARRVGPAARDAALLDVHLALSVRPEDVPYEADVPAGRAALNRNFYGPIAEAMAQGPRRVGDLLAIPDLEGRRDNPAELIGMMVGLRLAEVAIRPGAAPSPQALRLNQVTLANMAGSKAFSNPSAAASHALGAGVACTLFDLFVIDRLVSGEDEMQMDNWVRTLGGNLDDEARGKLREALAHSRQVLVPILQAQGVF